MRIVSSKPSRVVLSDSHCCVYCDSVDDLSVEHIIPYSLGGLIELPNGSCKICGDITKKFEQDIARDFLLFVRTTESIQTRRKKQRPNSAPVELHFSSGSKKKINVRLDECPISQATPSFFPFWGDFWGKGNFWAALGSDYGLRPGSDEKSLALINKYGASKIGLPESKISTISFVRLLLKIAACAVWDRSPVSVKKSEIRSRILLNNGAEVGKTLKHFEEPDTYCYPDIVSLAAPQFHTDVSTGAFRTYTRESNDHHWIYCDIQLPKAFGLPIYSCRVLNAELEEFPEKTYIPLQPHVA